MSGTGIPEWVKWKESMGEVLISACEMAVGQKGKVICPHSSHYGQILLRVNNGAVRIDGAPGESIETWAMAGGPEPHFNGPYVEVIDDYQEPIEETIERIEAMRQQRESK